jgi:hypothetical protein
VIPNITRGQRVQGLLFYLWGPGKKEEHVDPHLVAAWDGAGELADLEPVIAPAGKRDFRHLAELLEIPARAGRNPPRKPVWHCSLRTHPNDPILTDQQWQGVARYVMAKVGLAPNGDEQAVRWIAMRHGADHIHVVAILVRQDRRTYWARNDYPLAQAACRDLEAHHNLVRVGPPGSSSRSWPKAGELNKTARRRRPATPRDELRRRVRDAATVAVDEGDFFTRLTHDRMVTVRLRESERNPGQITGYAVHLTGDTAADDEPIFYGGGRLAADLSLTRLRQRWQPDTTLAGTDRRARQLRPIPAEIYQRAAALITDTTGYLTGNPEATAGIGAAAADVLTALAATWEGTTGGPLTRAAELFDRATHEPTSRHTAIAGTPGYTLRAVARILAAAGSRREQNELHAMLQLVGAVARVADAVADLRDAQQRLHQADAARQTAAVLAAYQPPAVPLSGRQHANQPTAVAAGVTTLGRPAQRGRSHPRGR